MKGTPLPILISCKDQKKRDTMGSRLRGQGYQVEIAKDPFHSLHLIEEKKFGLAILSTLQENMSSFELLTLMRQNFTKKTLPIIVMVNRRTSEQDLMDTVKVGANSCLVESDNVGQLVKEIEKLILTKKK